MKANWYGIYTKQNCEKKVAEFLNRRGIENYYPARIVKNWSFVKSVQPLLPCYVFVRTEENQLSTIKNFPGVINFLFWLGQPVVIQDSEIEIMKVVFSENTDVEVRKTEINFTKINDGPKISSSETDGMKTYKITLCSIGYTMITRTVSPKVTVISSLQNNYTIHPGSELLN